MGIVGCKPEKWGVNRKIGKKVPRDWGLGGLLAPTP